MMATFTTNTTTTSKDNSALARRCRGSARGTGMRQAWLAALAALVALAAAALAPLPAAAHPQVGSDSYRSWFWAPGAADTQWGEVVDGYLEINEALPRFLFERAGARAAADGDGDGGEPLHRYVDFIVHESGGAGRSLRLDWSLFGDSRPDEAELPFRSLVRVLGSAPAAGAPDAGSRLVVGGIGVRGTVQPGGSELDTGSAMDSDAGEDNGGSGGSGGSGKLAAKVDGNSGNGATSASGRRHPRAASVATVPGSLAYSPRSSTTTFRPLFVLMNFGDRNAACTRDQLINLMWRGSSSDSSRNGADSIALFSRGRVRLAEPASAGNYSEMVAGPFSFPSYSSTDSCDSNYLSWRTAARNAALAAGYDTTQFSTLVVVHPVLPSCGWLGRGSVWECSASAGDRASLPVCSVGVNSCQQFVVVHELGHNMNMAHSGKDENDDSVINAASASDVYGDLSCLMGYQSSWNVLNAPKMHMRGYLDASRVLAIDAPGDYALASLDDAAPAAGVPQVLTFADRVSSGYKYYYFSVRQTSLYAPSLLSAYTSGVQVHSRVSAYDYTLFNRALPAGSSFAGQNSGWLFTTRAFSSSAGTATLRVVHPSCAADPADCPFQWAGSTAWSACSCPAGTRTRSVQCTETATGLVLDDGWCVASTAPVTSSTCACAALPSCAASGDWPATAGGATASIACPAGSTGQQTRACLTTGAWAAAANTSACLLSCASDGVFAATAAGATASAACPTGFSGTRTRKCSATGSGSWETADMSGCVATITDCPAGAGYPATSPGVTVTGACPAGFSGNASRACKTDGTWAAINYGSCVAIMCPVSGSWPSTLAGTSASSTSLCPTGYTGTASRACNLDGSWASVDYSACVVATCAASGVFATTAAGATASAACPTGSTGTQTRACLITGTWAAAADTSACVADCAASGVWPQTAAGRSASAACAAGFTGTRTRACSAAGAWQAEVTSACVADCATDGTFPQTAAGATASAACPSLYSGTQFRTCSASGAWSGAENTSQCVATVCFADGSWPQTAVGSSVSLGCGTGFTGSVTRACGAGGAWAPPSTAGCVADCAADGAWPQTAAGAVATSACPSGFAGSQTRACSAAGSWQAAVSSACSKTSCDPTADGVWPLTSVGQTASASCPSGFSGTQTRACLVGGAWASANASLCVAVCAADGVWPATLAGRTATVSCNSSYPNGTVPLRTRACSGGTWAAASETECAAAAAAAAAAARPSSVTSLVLLDALTGVAVRTLANGDVLTYGLDLPSPATVVARCQTCEAVTFAFAGSSSYRIDRATPFSLFGDYVLQGATAYSGYTFASGQTTIGARATVAGALEAQSLTLTVTVVGVPSSAQVSSTNSTQNQNQNQNKPRQTQTQTQQLVSKRNQAGLWTEEEMAAARAGEVRAPDTEGPAVSSGSSPAVLVGGAVAATVVLAAAGFYVARTSKRRREAAAAASPQRRAPMDRASSNPLGAGQAPSQVELMGPDAMMDNASRVELGFTGAGSGSGSGSGSAPGSTSALALAVGAGSGSGLALPLGTSQVDLGLVGSRSALVGSGPRAARETRYHH